MKITFKAPIKKEEVLFVNINSKNTDEVVKENGVKTLYIKADSKMNLHKLYLLVRKMVQVAKGTKIDKFVFDFEDFKKIMSPSTTLGTIISDEELAEIIGTQLDFANYEFNDYKTPTKEGFKNIKEVFVLNTNKEIEKNILKGASITDEVNKTRTLSNIPGGDMTPQILAQKAKEAVKGLPVKVTVLGEKEMEKLKMQAILSVGRGSTEESKFIIMEYYGDKSRRPEGSGSRPKASGPIVLVGKGVTFDSGGMNLKPSSAILGMNMDMSGGASVIHTIALVAKIKLKVNVIALIPSVENMLSGNAYRPGDVIRSMSGKTIEVLNTDAEGRVILADALTYAQKYDPKLVVDVATLTGAACVALGERMSAIFTDDDELCKKFEKVGDMTGDYVWRLPMWEEFENEIKGSLGDYTNVHNKDSRWGGASYGAIFLHQFIKGYKWVHLDIAPRMTSMAGEFLAPGALGTPVRLLYKYIEENQ